MSEDDAEEGNADRIVPIEELERQAFLAGQYLRIRPRAPPEHSNNAEEDGDRQAVNDKHEAADLLLSRDIELRVIRLGLLVELLAPLLARLGGRETPILTVVVPIVGVEFL